MTCTPRYAFKARNIQVRSLRISATRFPGSIACIYYPCDIHGRASCGPFQVTDVRLGKEMFPI